jgi:hypothetical protein
MSDKESEESWTNPDYDRGMSRESHEEFMTRKLKEDKKEYQELMKGSYEYEYGKPSEKQIGGSHYKDCAIQPVDYIVENKLDFLEGNVVKYITRHKTKNGIEDIRKVIHYAELILEKKYGKEK